LKPALFSIPQVNFKSGEINPGEVAMFIEMANDRSAVPKSHLFTKRLWCSSSSDPGLGVNRTTPGDPRSKGLSESDCRTSKVTETRSPTITSVSYGEVKKISDLSCAFGNIIDRDEPKSSTSKFFENKLSDISENESISITMESASDSDGHTQISNEVGKPSANLKSSTHLKETKWKDKLADETPDKNNAPTSNGPVQGTSGTVSFPVPFVRTTQSAITERNNLDRKYSFVSSSTGQGRLKGSTDCRLPPINTEKHPFGSHSLFTNLKADDMSEFTKRRRNWAHAFIALKTKHSRSTTESDEDTVTDFASVVQRLMKSNRRNMVDESHRNSAAEDCSQSMPNNQGSTVDPENGDRGERGVGASLQMSSNPKTMKSHTCTSTGKRTKNQKPETQEMDNLVKKIAVSLPCHLLLTATNHGQDLAEKQSAYSARKKHLLEIEHKSTSRKAMEDPRFQRLMGSLSPRPAEGQSSVTQIG
jgi:hypothetical protein